MGGTCGIWGIFASFKMDFPGLWSRSGACMALVFHSFSC
jgi:hypothetical protein